MEAGFEPAPEVLTLLQSNRLSHDHAAGARATTHRPESLLCRGSATKSNADAAHRAVAARGGARSGGCRLVCA